MGTRYAQVKLKIPEGFSILLEKFAREVLREQPPDIVTFAANYFRQLLSKRNETGEDPIEYEVAIRKRIYEDAYDGDSSRILRPANALARKEERESKAAVHIQAGVRGYLTRKHLKQEWAENEAAVTIQAGYRGYKARRENKESAVKDEPLSDCDADQVAAATRIQANYRGYRTRKKMTAKQEKKVTFQEEETVKENAQSAEAKETEMECKEDEDTDTNVQEAEIKQDSADAEVVDVDLNDPELKAAASKIQASFRRFKTKQTIDADVPHEESLTRSDTEKKEEEGKDQDADTIQENDLSTAEQVDTTETAIGIEIGDAPQGDDKITEENAAIKIQAGFRGYKARKSIQQKDVEQEHAVDEGGDRLEENSSMSQVVDVDVTEAGDTAAVDAVNQSKEHSVIKIQAQYRGYRTRKQLEEQRQRSMITAEETEDKEEGIAPVDESEA